MPSAHDLPEGHTAPSVGTLTAELNEMRYKVAKAIVTKYVEGNQSHNPHAISNCITNLAGRLEIAQYVFGVHVPFAIEVVLFQYTTEHPIPEYNPIQNHASRSWIENCTEYIIKELR